MKTSLYIDHSFLEEFSRRCVDYVLRELSICLYANDLKGISPGHFHLCLMMKEGSETK